MRASRDWEGVAAAGDAKALPRSPQRPSGRGTGVLAWLVMLLLICAAAVGGLQLYQLQAQSSRTFAQLEKRIADLELALERVDATAATDLDGLREGVAAQETRLDAMAELLEADQRHVEEVVAALHTLDTNFSELVDRFPATEERAQNNASRLDQLATDLRIARSRIETITREVQAIEGIYAQLLELRTADEAASKSIRGFDEYRKQLNRALLKVKGDLSLVAQDLEALREEVSPL